MFFCRQENKLRIGIIFSSKLANHTKETRFSFEQTGGEKNTHLIQFSSLVNKQTNPFPTIKKSAHFSELVEK